MNIREIFHFSNYSHLSKISLTFSLSLSKPELSVQLSPYITTSIESRPRGTESPGQGLMGENEAVYSGPGHKEGIAPPLDQTVT